ncbi:MAG: ice-binding family protein [Syntrophobacteraceae bacterium]|jgi:hypothetical protein
MNRKIIAVIIERRLQLKTKRLFLSLAFVCVFAAFGVAAHAAQLPVNLGLAGNYAILAKSGITTTGTTLITGNIGVSPITSTAITGFNLTIDGSGQFATSPLVTGKVYAADYAAPTPSNLSTAISNMQAAYADAAGRTLPDATELGAGKIGGLTITPGLYKWSTSVLINTNTAVILSGGPNDVWIFQIAGNLTVADGANVTLIGGAQASNIFWQVAGGVSVAIGTNAHMEGIILAQNAITMNTDSSWNGRALAMKNVTLIADDITAPATASTTKTLFWAGTGGYASIWNLDSSNNVSTSTVYGFNSGWTPVSYSSNSDGTRTMLWAGTGGYASIWTFDGSNNYTTQQQYGPYSGWTPVSYSSNSDGTRTLLWAGTGGYASIWTLNSSNNYITSTAYGPYSGWTPVSYSSNSDGTRTVLWAGPGGSASIWTLNGSNNYITSTVYGPFSGWTPVSYSSNSDGTRNVLWAGIGGSASIWTLNSSNNYTGSTVYGPYSGWTPVSYSYNSDGTRTLLWAGTGGYASIWTLDSSNNFTTYIEYGPYSGWEPVSYQ